MQTRGALFDSRSTARGAVEALRKQGVADKRIDIIMPGTPEKEFEAKAEALRGQTGEGAWSAMGAGIGSFAGAAFASALIPGVGPLLVLGGLAAAFVVGGFGGKLVGDAIEHSHLHDDVQDDTYLLFDAVRREKAVVIVSIEDKDDPESIAAILSAAGGQSFDEAREGWWRSRRDAEATWYEAQGYGGFDRAERAYRRGFQVSFDPRFSGRSYEQIAVKLRELFKDSVEDDFRRGFERGLQLQWNMQADASAPTTSQGAVQPPAATAAAVAAPPVVSPPVVRETARLSSPSHPGG